jgi:peptidoglycan/xylan/chitin deacetylase (PgdA/CDA1 family)
VKGPWKTAFVTAMGVTTLGWSDELALESHPSHVHVDQLRTDSVAPEREPLDGRAFPDGVLALTWDDGPDVYTLELARYLAAERVSATFFVVAEWDRDVSSEPGVGKAVYATGYRRIPILGDLVRLGHRVGNHTLDHALLADASIEAATDQLAREQVEIDPFVTNELRMFRAPGGQWSSDAASALDDPRLAGLVGPVRWDVDAKDWEGSLYCRSTAPARECELGRVRPEVIADRYAARIERARKGIVLLHDRVGDVGSRYALDVAKRLVPRLKARGYVFAAPVLAFSPLATRDRVPETHSLSGDINGDGNRDECAITTSGVACALSNGRSLAKSTTWLDVRVDDAWLVDVNGDGRSDLCTRRPEGIACGLAP